MRTLIDVTFTGRGVILPTDLLAVRLAHAAKVANATSEKAKAAAQAAFDAWSAQHGAEAVAEAKGDFIRSSTGKPQATFSIRLDNLDAAMATATEDADGYLTGITVRQGQRGRNPKAGVAVGALRSALTAAAAPKGGAAEK